MLWLCSVSLRCQLDNFDDNAFEWFTLFHDAAPGSPYFDNGVLPVWDIVASFADLVAKDALPQGPVLAEATLLLAPSPINQSTTHTFCTPVSQSATHILLGQ